MNNDVAQTLKDIITPLLTSTLETVKSDLKDVKDEMKNLQTSLGEVKTNVGVLQNAVSTVKDDVNSIKTDVSNLSNKVGELTTSITTAGNDMEDLEGHYKEDHDKLFGTDGLSEQFKALQNQRKGAWQTLGIICSLVIGIASLIAYFTQYYQNQQLLEETRKQVWQSREAITTDPHVWLENKKRTN